MLEFSRISSLYKRCNDQHDIVTQISQYIDIHIADIERSRTLQTLDPNNKIYLAIDFFELHRYALPFNSIYAVMPSVGLPEVNYNPSIAFNEFISRIALFYNPFFKCILLPPYLDEYVAFITNLSSSIGTPTRKVSRGSKNINKQDSMLQQLEDLVRSSIGGQISTPELHEISKKILDGEANSSDFAKLFKCSIDSLPSITEQLIGLKLQALRRIKSLLTGEDRRVWIFRECFPFIDEEFSRNCHLSARAILDVLHRKPRKPINEMRDALAISYVTHINKYLAEHGGGCCYFVTSAPFITSVISMLQDTIEGSPDAQLSVYLANIKEYFLKLTLPSLNDRLDAFACFRDPKSYYYLTQHSHSNINNALEELKESQSILQPVLEVHQEISHLINSRPGTSVYQQYSVFSTIIKRPLNINKWEKTLQTAELLIQKYSNYTGLLKKVPSTALTYEDSFKNVESSVKWMKGYYDALYNNTSSSRERYLAIEREISETLLGVRKAASESIDILMRLATHAAYDLQARVVGGALRPICAVITNRRARDAAQFFDSVCSSIAYVDISLYIQHLNSLLDCPRGDDGQDKIAWCILLLLRGFHSEVQYYLEQVDFTGFSVSTGRELKLIGVFAYLRQRKFVEAEQLLIHIEGDLKQQRDPRLFHRKSLLHWERETELDPNPSSEVMNRIVQYALNAVAWAEYVDVLPNYRLLLINNAAYFMSYYNRIDLVLNAVEKFKEIRSSLPDVGWWPEMHHTEFCLFRKLAQLTDISLSQEEYLNRARDAIQSTLRKAHELGYETYNYAKLKKWKQEQKLMLE